jgi:hypothetical protein
MTLNVFEKHFSIIFELKIYNINVMYTNNFIDNYYTPNISICYVHIPFKSYVCGINSRSYA